MMIAVHSVMWVNKFLGFPYGDQNISEVVLRKISKINMIKKSLQVEILKIFKYEIGFYITSEFVAKILFRKEWVQNFSLTYFIKIVKV